MNYAKIDNGNIVEIRNIDEASIPEHKRYMWLPVVDNVPEVNKFYYNVVANTPVVLSDKVLIEYTVTPHPVNLLQALVKQEAERRILEFYPLWKQSNMLSDKLTLLNKTRTPEEEQQLIDIDAGFAYINHIRQRSNIIEAMDPIPENYVADTYWE